MKHNQIARFAAIALALSTVAARSATGPQIVNASLEQRAAGANLESDLRSLAGASSAPSWAGWSFPAIAGEHRFCCNGDWNGETRCDQCRLEGNGDYVINGGNHAPENHEVQLEAGDTLVVMLRFQAGRIEKIRVFSEDCTLDAGGRKVTWLTGVQPAQSVSVLASLATGSTLAPVKDADSNGIFDGAVVAIAHHADPSADSALASFVAPDRPAKLRESTAFWLAAARGRPGYDLLLKLAREDTDDRFREKLMFDFSVSKEPQAIDALIERAHRDESSRVRGQALFWLAQKAGRRAMDTIRDAIQDDPETEVKKKAVFALSQLPKDEGVPLLIQTARTQRNPAIRKEAMFWLGQSNDPRALAFFEEALK